MTVTKCSGHEQSGSGLSPTCSSGADGEFFPVCHWGRDTDFSDEPGLDRRLVNASHSQLLHDMIWLKTKEFPKVFSSNWFPKWFMDLEHIYIFTQTKYLLFLVIYVFHTCHSFDRFGALETQHFPVLVDVESSPSHHVYPTGLWDMLEKSGAALQTLGGIFYQAASAGSLELSHARLGQ